FSMLQSAQTTIRKIWRKSAYMTNNQFINIDLHPTAIPIPFSALRQEKRIDLLNPLFLLQVSELPAARS
ncbi:MAG: hypothetical protein K2I97_05460, partial [Alistipes sp.]|nr:hypothetical protein [Alistipes sp.]